DTSSLGSARAIVYQIRCAFAHDPRNPVWTPDPRRYKYTYCITVNVPRALGDITPRTITFDPTALMKKHLSSADFGGLGGYFALLTYCLKETENDPRGKAPYVPPVEP